MVWLYYATHIQPSTGMPAQVEHVHVIIKQLCDLADMKNGLNWKKCIQEKSAKQLYAMGLNLIENT